MRIIFLYAISLYITELNGYPNGAPNNAAVCQTMIPGHLPPENSGDAPFEITLSENIYEPGTSITVTISKNDTTPFRGFLLQARRSESGADQDTAIGSFNVDSEADAQTTCDSISTDSAATHENNNDKDNITVVWNAPSVPEGNIVFRATVVEEFTSGGTSRYWRDLLSEEVTGPAAGTEETVTEDGTAANITMDPIDVSACGQEKGCYRDPPQCNGGQECEYLVTWKVNGDVVDFEISAKISNEDYWTAVGFSLDQEMGDDSVNNCIYDSTSGTTKVEASWNTQTPKNNELLDNPNLGLANSVGATVDDRIQCTFSRQITVTNITSARASNAMNDADRIYNLSSNYYLLLARGLSAAGSVIKHQDPPRISPEMVDVSDNNNYQDIGGSAKNALVITHGSLMIFAWLVFVSVGVLMPRYYKTAWPGEELCGKQVWFQIHRPVMVLGVTLTLVAFIVIFVEVDGYATDLTGVDAAHPILGIIVTALAITNPIMAIFRPHPGTPNRPIFNWAHFAVGTLAQVLAAVTIFLGTRLSKADMSSWAQWLVVGCVVYHCMIEIVLTAHKYSEKKEKETGNADLQLQGVNGVKPLDSNEKGTNGLSDITSSNNLVSSRSVHSSNSSTIIRTVVIGIHFVGVLAFAIVLVVDLAS